MPQLPGPCGRCGRWPSLARKAMGKRPWYMMETHLFFNQHCQKRTPTLVFQGPAKPGSFLILTLAPNGSSAKGLLFQGPGRSRFRFTCHINSEHVGLTASKSRWQFQRRASCQAAVSRSMNLFVAWGPPTSSLTNMGVGQNFQPPGIGPQVLVLGSIYRGNPFWGDPMFDPPLGTPSRPSQKPALPPGVAMSSERREGA